MKSYPVADELGCGMRHNSWCYFVDVRILRSLDDEDLKNAERTNTIVMEEKHQTPYKTPSRPRKGLQGELSALQLLKMLGFILITQASRHRH